MSDPENPLEGTVNVPPEVTELPEAVQLQAPVVTPFAAEWPARTWVPAERVTAGMMNGMRDQLNDLHAAQGVAIAYTPTVGSIPTAGMIASFSGDAFYTIFGKTMFLELSLILNITGSMTEALIYLPAPYTVAAGGANRGSSPFSIYPIAGGWGPGLGYGLPSANHYRVQMAAGFPISAGTYVWGTAIIPLS